MFQCFKYNEKFAKNKISYYFFIEKLAQKFNTRSFSVIFFINCHLLFSA